MTVLRRLVEEEPRTPMRIRRLMDAGLLDQDVGQEALDELGCQA